MPNPMSPWVTNSLRNWRGRLGMNRGQKTEALGKDVAKLKAGKAGPDGLALPKVDPTTGLPVGTVYPLDPSTGLPSKPTSGVDPTTGLPIAVKELAEQNAPSTSLPALAAEPEVRAAIKVPPPVPQPEVSTAVNPFSTFSLNVADVSFRLAEASLNQGQMPDPGSIRSEEFINAFDYRDPEPAPGMPVAFMYDRTRSPFAHNRDLLRFSIKTASRRPAAGLPAEPGAVARQFRVHGARRPREHPPRSPPGAGGPVAARGQDQPDHLLAHRAAVGCGCSRQPGTLHPRTGQSIDPRGRHESRRGDEPRLPDRAAAVPRRAASTASCCSPTARPTWATSIRTN